MKLYLYNHLLILFVVVCIHLKKLLTISFLTFLIEIPRIYPYANNPIPTLLVIRARIDPKAKPSKIEYFNCFFISEKIFFLFVLLSAILKSLSIHTIDNCNILKLI
jgi:hypothetical protein